LANFGVQDYRQQVRTGAAAVAVHWVSECTLAWLNRCRRLEDFENLTHNALAFL
jgi:hypothetical protein